MSRSIACGIFFAAANVIKKKNRGYNMRGKRGHGIDRKSVSHECVCSKLRSFPSFESRGREETAFAADSRTGLQLHSFTFASAPEFASFSSFSPSSSLVSDFNK